MIKIKYIGTANPGRVTVYDVTFNWTKGEIKEIEEVLANKLLENSDYFKVENEIKVSTKNEFSKKRKED